MIKAGGQIVVTSPKRISQRYVEKFLLAKADWLLETLKKYEAVSPKPKADTRAEYLVYKKVAEKLITERLQHFNTIYGFSWNRVSVRNQTTRWGSCSKKGNLNFSYKLALLPQRLSDYIVVHELCHLKEMNHSPRFWKLVEVTIPDYVARRKELRRIGKNELSGTLPSSGLEVD